MEDLGHADSVRLDIWAAQSRTTIDDLTRDQWVKLFDLLRDEPIWSFERVSRAYDQI
jgi:hypothetical protein